MDISNDFYVVCIGSSAGGLEPLKEFFKNLMLDVAASFVVISHLPANEPSRLDLILARCTEMPVSFLVEDTVIDPYTVYVLPGNLRVKYEKGRLIIRKRLGTEHINYAIDEFLHSLAEGKREKALAIILSGMGTDGTKGAKAIYDNGGLVLAQTPSSTDFACQRL